MSRCSRNAGVFSACAKIIPELSQRQCLALRNVLSHPSAHLLIRLSGKEHLRRRISAPVASALRLSGSPIWAAASAISGGEYGFSANRASRALKACCPGVNSILWVFSAINMPRRLTTWSASNLSSAASNRSGEFCGSAQSFARLTRREENWHEIQPGFSTDCREWVQTSAR